MPKTTHTTAADSFAQGMREGREGVQHHDPAYIALALAVLLGVFILGCVVAYKFIRWALR